MRTFSFYGSRVKGIARIKPGSVNYIRELERMLTVAGLQGAPVVMARLRPTSEPAPLFNARLTRDDDTGWHELTGYQFGGGDLKRLIAERLTGEVDVYAFMVEATLREEIGE